MSGAELLIGHVGWDPRQDRPTTRPASSHAGGSSTRSSLRSLGRPHCHHEARDVQPSSRTNPSTCRKIKYSNRNDTPVPVRSEITAGQRRGSKFWHPTCVLKWSGDDVEDRQHEACCTSDGGGPSGFAVQAEIPNHRKLRRLRAGVVSVAVEVPRVAGQVCDEKTNVCEPLLTHRNKQRRHRNRTVWGVPGQRRAFRGAPSAGERPACGPGGARCIGGVSSSQALVWNRRTCRPDSAGRKWVILAYGSREGGLGRPAFFG